MDRYGPAIEWDLHHELGLDLVDFFRGKYSWRKLSDLLARMRAGTQTWAAQVNDDEVAEAYLAAHPDEVEGSNRRIPPDLEDMSLVVQYLMGLTDMVGSVIDSLAAIGGAKGPATRPVPRPRTALDRARDKRVQSSLEGLLAEAYEAMGRTE